MKRLTTIASLLSLLWIGPATALPMFTGFQSNPETDFPIIRGDDTLVSLVYNPGLFGSGVIASGLFDLNTGDSNPPDGGIWLAQDVAGALPPDDTKVLSFRFDSSGDFMGVDPTPFRIFLAALPGDGLGGPTMIGELDFSTVTDAVMGSLLDITGLTLLPTGGGDPVVIQPFNVESVPEPATLTLLALGLAGMGLARRRNQSKKCHSRGKNRGEAPLLQLFSNANRRFHQKTGYCTYYK